MSRIENLGDYNEVRIDLKNFGGNKEALYNSIGKKAVVKAAPKFLALGGLVGAVLGGRIRSAIWSIRKCDVCIKDRKERSESEADNKEEFDKMLDDKLKEQNI